MHLLRTGSPFVATKEAIIWLHHPDRSIPRRRCPENCCPWCATWP